MNAPTYISVPYSMPFLDNSMPTRDDEKSGSCGNFEDLDLVLANPALYLNADPYLDPKD